MEELFIAIREAAITIATPNWATALSGAASFGAILVAIVVAFTQNKIAKEQSGIMQKQTEIVQEQAETTKRQTEIVKRQAGISEQQNKISLFKERYAVYCECRKVISLGKQLEDVKLDYEITKEIHSQILAATLVSTDYLFGTKFCTNKHVAREAWLEFLAQIQLSEYRIKEAIFLFHDIEEKDIDDLIQSWRLFVSCLLIDTQSLAPYDKDNFSEKCAKFSDKYIKQMENALNLK